MESESVKLSESEKPESIELEIEIPNEKRLNEITERISTAFESTNFSRFMNQLKDRIKAEIESEIEKVKKIELSSLKEKIQQYHWKLKKKQGKKETSFKNIAERILKVEQLINKEIV